LKDLDLPPTVWREQIEDGRKIRRPTDLQRAYFVESLIAFKNKTKHTKMTVHVSR
jgi:hypothetical protein